MDIRQATLRTWSDPGLDLLASIQPNLVLVFAAPEHFLDPNLATRLAEAFPQARRVGASTAGKSPRPVCRATASSSPPCAWNKPRSASRPPTWAT